MKLLLTSDGLLNKNVTRQFLSLLPQEPKDCSVLMVAYAATDEEQSYVNESEQELLDLGINKITVFKRKQLWWKVMNIE